MECDGRREVDGEWPKPQIEGEAVGDSGEKCVPGNDEHLAPGVVRGEPLDDGDSRDETRAHANPCGSDHLKGEPGADAAGNECGGE